MTKKQIFVLAFVLMGLFILLRAGFLWKDANTPHIYADEELNKIIYGDAASGQNRINSDLNSLKERVDTIEEDLCGIKDDVFDAKIKLILQEKRSSCVFNAKQDIRTGFQILELSCGYFFVSIQNVEPCLDGYKVTISIGNPHFATFSDVVVNFKWNYALLSNKENFKHLKEWKKNLKEKNCNISSSLLPGKWNKIELFLTPAKLTDLEYLEFSITNMKVILG